MAIRKRFVVCDCGEQFEEEADQTLIGNVNYGPWRYTQHSVRPSTVNDQDVVTVHFVRTVVCEVCDAEMFKEKKGYEVRPQATPKPTAKANEVIQPPRPDTTLRIVGNVPA